MHKNNNKYAIVISSLILLVVFVTIIYGDVLTAKGVEVRRWPWSNLLVILPVVPLLFLQQQVSLPALQTIQEKKYAWRSTFGVGMIFGILDVIVIKLILHPQPYTSLPPFLQPFPYSIPLYTAGAIEIELYYRMIPLMLFLCLDQWLFQLKHRKIILIILAVLTSLVEPIQQFPDGALWFIIYATVSGIAMNLWQFKSYVQYGFVASLAVRLGHYLVWHILLGLFVEYIELH
jgi:hypothetical protein